ncbi:MAG: prepilin-type N-terminal cleavage/methylation domain-containing protein [Candidatus Taylorbacteria bacterium]|nr:prepilin-type N-terminal cleavage/methylation domain-containing protein [Candidatus Taylorbacteria bacterium]
MNSLLRKKRGFTLIELLVVVSIISLLSAVVLSSLNASRSRARDARRLADMQSLRTAISLYLNDSGNVYPPATPDRGDGWAESYTAGAGFMSNLVSGGYLASPIRDPENTSAYKSYYYRVGTYGGCTAPATRAVLHLYLTRPATSPYIACSAQATADGMYGACLCLD